MLTSYDTQPLTTGWAEESSSGEFGLVAILVNDTAHSPTVNYLIDRLSVVEARGGPEFLARVAESGQESDRTFLLLDCSHDRLLREAERCQLRKTTLRGDIVPFTMHPKHGFEFDTRNILSDAERCRLALHILSRVTVNANDQRQNSELKRGGSIVSQLSLFGVVGDIFPLHNTEQLQCLGNQWYNARLDMFEPCYDKIRDYFGEKIAVYFAFLGYYTRALFLPSCLALYNCLLRFHDDNVHAQAPFAAFNIIYLSIFLKFWKRRCSSFACKWGTYDYEKYEMIRPEFQGQLRPSPITKKLELWYPDSSRYRIMICITYPIVFFCLIISLLMVWAYFIVQLWAEKRYPNFTFRDVCLLNLPNIVYSIIIYFSNYAYKILSVKLTQKENHRLPSEYDYHLLMKLILLQFVNCFCYLFYVAFILRDMERLRRYLACNLVTWQIVQQVLECVWPFIRIYCSQKMTLYKVDPRGRRYIEKDVAVESRLDLFEDTFDDYLEMWLQFGYAFMFSSVFPMASLYAFVNNLMEMRGDAFKLCVTMRRPFPQLADSMGIWQSAFEALIIMAVMTNCALLCMTATKADAFRTWNLWKVVLLFVLVEHVMLLFYFALNKLIPDVPEKVRVKIERSEYLAMQQKFCCNPIDMASVSRAARRETGRQNRSRSGSGAAAANV